MSRNVSTAGDFLVLVAGRRTTTVVVAIALLCGTIPGCRHGDQDASRGRRKTYPLRGVVVRTDYAKGEVVLNQEAIPGLMGAMTMTYPLPTPGILFELHPGDKVSARLWAASDGAGGTGLRLDRVEVTPAARPDSSPKVRYHVPATGDVPPDFPLVNENGRVLHLSDFRGKAVLLTFIHTRCDIAIYCPKMSENFAEIEKTLAADPAVYAKTHLITISFDPAYDTPEVLRGYAAKYVAPAGLAHWDFAAPLPGDLTKVEEFFNLRVSGKGAALVHSLATVTIGKDGKVVGFSPNSDLKTPLLLEQVRSIAKQ